MYAHTPTMYLLAVTVSLALAISVATLVPIGSRKREGMLLWALGLFLYALTYLMYGLRGQVSNFFSIGVGNTALSAGLAMFTHAMLVFQQRQWFCRAKPCIDNGTWPHCISNWQTQPYAACSNGCTFRWRSCWCAYAGTRPTR